MKVLVHEDYELLKILIFVIIVIYTFLYQIQHLLTPKLKKKHGMDEVNLFALPPDSEIESSLISAKVQCLQAKVSTLTKPQTFSFTQMLPMTFSIMFPKRFVGYKVRKTLNTLFQLMAGFRKI